MVIVTGTVLARHEHLSEAVALCLQHVHRSRLEPGCLFHSVHRDVEEPNRLFFFEQWEDRRSLARHFALAESGAFVVALARLTIASPEIAIYDVESLVT